jgi:hypothetical protein
MHDGMGCLCPEAIPLSAAITGLIGHFAATKELIFLPFYHDLPIWIVSEPEPLMTGDVHRVQVTAIQESGRFYLAIMPAVEFVDYSSHRMAVLEEVPPKLGIEFGFYDPFNPAPLDKDNLKGALETVWAQAQLLSVKDSKTAVWTPLSDALRKKPPPPSKISKR